MKWKIERLVKKVENYLKKDKIILTNIERGSEYKVNVRKLITKCLNQKLYRGITPPDYRIGNGERTIRFDVVDGNLVIILYWRNGGGVSILIK